jgi:hypothetical protein
MTWVLIVWVSMLGEYAIPGIASEAECRALYVKIEKSKPGRANYDFDKSRANCIPYEAAK